MKMRKWRCTDEGFVDNYPVFVPVGFNSWRCNLGEGKPERSKQAIDASLGYQATQ